MAEPPTPAPVSAEQFIAILRGDTTIEAITERRKARRILRVSGRLQNQFEAILREMPDSKLKVARRHWHVAWAAVTKVHSYDFQSQDATAFTCALSWAIRRVCAERPAVIERVKRNRASRRAAAESNRGQGKAKNR